MSDSLTPKTLETLLDGLGWPHTRINDDTWRSSAKTHQGKFQIHIRHDKRGYLTFAIVPYLRSPEDSEQANRLYAKLLRLNQQIMFAAFSIDDDLDVVLSVDFPTADLDKSEFEDALRSLVFYADQYYPELKEWGLPV